MLSPRREAWPLSGPAVPRHGPVGLVHVDAHMDTADKALGEKLYHGTPFRRCVDEGLLDCKRVVQIGIRGSSMTLDPCRYSRSQVTGRTPPFPAFLSTAYAMALWVPQGLIKFRKWEERLSLHPEGHVEQRGARVSVRKAEAASSCLGGETADANRPRGCCWLGKELGGPEPKARGRFSFHLHTRRAEWPPGEHIQDPAGKAQVPGAKASLLGGAVLGSRSCSTQTPLIPPVGQP